MSKIIDITDKLNFKEKPTFKIKDTVLEANNDAPTMLKVIALMSEGSIKPTDVYKAYELLFDEENRQKMEALKLDLEDFVATVMAIAESLIGTADDVGETQTPATT